MNIVQIKGNTIIRIGLGGVVLLVVLAVTGCGGSSPTSTTSSQISTSTASGPAPSGSPETGPSPTASSPTPASEQAPSSTQGTSRIPPVSIKLVALGVGSGQERTIPTKNTCDGANTPVSFEWKEVPHGTAELALFVLNVVPVREKAFVDWAVAGIDPRSHGIASGSLPSGAIVGTNGFGKAAYSICPPSGTGETYIARLVALPRSIPVRSGFNGEAFYQEAERITKAVGVTGVGRYSR